MSQGICESGIINASNIVLPQGGPFTSRIFQNGSNLQADNASGGNINLTLLGNLNANGALTANNIVLSSLNTVGLVIKMGNNTPTSVSTGPYIDMGAAYAASGIIAKILTYNNGTDSHAIGTGTSAGEMAFTLSNVGYNFGFYTGGTRKFNITNTNITTALPIAPSTGDLQLSPATANIKVNTNTYGAIWNTDGANTNVRIQGLSGPNSGYMTLSFNGYFNGTEQRDNTSKLRWRYLVDQRGASDIYRIESYDGATTREHLTINPTTGQYVQFLQGIATNSITTTSGDLTVSPTANIVLNPTGTIVNFSSKNLTSCGNITIPSNTGAIQLGTAVDTSTPTPTKIDMGATYSNVAGANPKLLLYNNGTTPFGLGISAAQMDYIIPSTSAHVLYVGATEKLRLNSGNLQLTSANVTTASGDMTLIPAANLVLNPLGGNIYLPNKSGTVIRIGDTTPVGSTNPAVIDMGVSYSNVAGNYPKLKIFNNTISNIFGGLGFSTNQQLDYMVSANSSHVKYIGGVEMMRLDNANLTLTNNNALVIPSNNGTLIKLGDATTGTATANPATIDMGTGYSNVLGSNLKLKLFNSGVSVYGLGVSTGQLDYVVPSGSSHSLYYGASLMVQLNSSFLLQNDTPLAGNGNLIVKPTLGRSMFSDGANTNINIQTILSGFHVIGFNGYYSNAGAEVRNNTAKLRWRITADQRTTADAFSLDSYNGTATTTYMSVNPSANTYVSFPVGLTSPTYINSIFGSSDFSSTVISLQLCTWTSGDVPYINTAGLEDNTERSSTTVRITKCGYIINILVLQDTPNLNTGAAVSYTVFAANSAPLGQSFASIQSTYPPIPSQYIPSTTQNIPGFRISGTGTAELVNFVIDNVGMFYIIGGRGGTSGSSYPKVPGTTMTWTYG